eukprot:1159396-Pelagomonas_calceolata.AAC.6
MAWPVLTAQFLPELLRHLWNAQGMQRAQAGDGSFQAIMTGLWPPHNSMALMLWKKGHIKGHGVAHHHLKLVQHSKCSDHVSFPSCLQGPSKLGPIHRRHGRPKKDVCLQCPGCFFPVAAGGISCGNHWALRTRLDEWGAGTDVCSWYGTLGGHLKLNQPISDSLAPDGWSKAINVGVFTGIYVMDAVQINVCTQDCSEQCTSESRGLSYLQRCSCDDHQWPIKHSIVNSFWVQLDKNSDDNSDDNSAHAAASGSLPATAIQAYHLWAHTRRH